MGSSLLGRAVQAVVVLLALAFGVRLASAWLASSLPILLVFGGLVTVLWLVLGRVRARSSRNPFGGGWP